eukprot:TRINITY_DN91_c2_g1_i1.p1 TRINITY_DN91_c2_g1~~TRINITY_DN91_c2_g1_i1.p1  ORF type:complete len:431 (+),score=81.98 TRINITY_DN91_c2_g1_i1:89-1381(+)
MAEPLYRLKIFGANQLVTVCTDGGCKFKKGEEQGKIDIITKGTIIIGKDGRIVDLGTDEDINKKLVYNDHSLFERVIDASGHCVLPGLVDSHTHPVWSGDRSHEFKLKLAGVPYMEIHKQGGGIGFTVRHTREASEDQLLELLLNRLDRMMKLGTTTVEAKSGYGLDEDNEIKMLKVIHKANKKHSIDLIGNYCGAHSVPSGSNADQYTHHLINHIIPKIKELKEKDEISPTLIDVFCEKNVFDIEQTRKILTEGNKIGLEANFHGDELSPIKAGELAGEVGALAMSHCEETSPEGIKSMAKRPTVAVLLPTTAYILKLKYPPARDMISEGVPVAVGTDFNPNAHCMSMPFAMNLACVNMKLTLEESLVAATINSAAALGRSHDIGSLSVGKLGDMILIKSNTWEHIIYQMIDPPITHVVKNGGVVYEQH